MALEHSDVRALAAPFALEAHEWRKGRNNSEYVYLTETGVVNRLNEVDPSWTLVVTDRTERHYITERKNAKGEAYSITAHELAITVSLTVKGVTRYGIGMAEVAADAAEADKSAVTDALKRAARLFGVGAYLLNDPPSNKQQFPAWLARQGGQQNAPKSSPAPEPPAPTGTPFTKESASEFEVKAAFAGVNRAEALENVLKVSTYGQFTGTYEDALARLDEYLKGGKK